MADAHHATALLRDHALKIFQAALAAVDGRHAVIEALRRQPTVGPCHLVAVGKAAAAMTRGAIAAAGDALVAGLVITKHGHAGPLLGNDPRLTVLESDHPIPGEASLEAGDVLLRFIDDAPRDARLLFLLSGGASSLVEVLPEGVTLDDYRRANEWLLASGLDIHQVNAVRKRLSGIKGGKLAHRLQGRTARCLLISDVPGDRLSSIGSGLLVPDENVEAPGYDHLPGWLQELVTIDAPPGGEGNAMNTVPHEIVANNQRARSAACERARQLGYAVSEHIELLVGDAATTGRQCARETMLGENGVVVWGGETTVALPQQPGRGGRNQSAALGAALELSGNGHCVILAAGTDGTDGPTEDAGALVDGGTIARGAAEGLDAAESLANADAGTFLAASGDLIQTGPTGTNVMDLVVGIKQS